jgi:hypothetical protein
MPLQETGHGLATAKGSLRQSVGHIVVSPSWRAAPLTRIGSVGQNPHTAATARLISTNRLGTHIGLALLALSAGALGWIARRRPV